ncbi:uncharacterized protein EDB91DRAFT_1241633 [Suillus paluster]|uniref:uncharacterized protein n=1 Tax=Suillus paluster TaxID=48578 RepID=UPI001B878C68|nr:uncharacterized protein EDB91DRAFT_1241633 [Suillus paluster]KAG1756587.1 hypothetical protein EDB91DRAFT_1241633 [Suillus paluster]
MPSHHFPVHSATIPLPIRIFPKPSTTWNQAEPSGTQRNNRVLYTSYPFSLQNVLLRPVLVLPSSLQSPRDEYKPRTLIRLLIHTESIFLTHSGIEMRWLAAESDAEELAAMIVSVIYNSQSGIGQSTRVMGISYIPPAPPGSQHSIPQVEHLICKDVWQNINLYSDAKIHQLLEDSEHVDKAKLKIDVPDTIEETAHEVQLTKSLYTLWSASPGWDADICSKYPLHLPIRDKRFSLDPVIFTDPKSGESLPDTTGSILWGMAGMVDPLVHLRTFFRTPTVKCTWFLCCWELLHCHLEAYRRGIIHRDTSDSNVWMWIPQIDEWFAVPEWIKEQDGKTHFRMVVVNPEWFPRRPGVAGDFGLALDMLESKSTANGVVTTVEHSLLAPAVKVVLKGEVTQRASASARALCPLPEGTGYDTSVENEAPGVTHDLEAYIYLIWLIGVNFKGPYNDIQHWPPPVEKQRPIPNNAVSMSEANRLTAKKFGCAPINKKCFPPSMGVTQIGTTRILPKREEDKEFWIRQRKVPAWAKVGTYDLTTETVKMDKLCLDSLDFMGVLQPYWKVGTLCDGWIKLYNLLWLTDNDGRAVEEKRTKLTHARLIAMIREMIATIPAAVDGAPSQEVVLDAWERYSASINRLVNVQTLKIRQFHPVSVYLAEYLSGSRQELPPPSSNPLQAAPSSSTSEPLLFIPYMPNMNVPGPQMQPPTSSKMHTSSRRRSGHVGMGTRSGSQRGRAAPTAPVLSPHQSPHQSTHSAHWSGGLSGTSHVFTDPSIGSTLTEGHTSGSGSRWSGVTQVSDTENENKHCRRS